MAWIGAPGSGESERHLWLTRTRQRVHLALRPHHQAEKTREVAAARQQLRDLLARMHAGEREALGGFALGIASAISFGARRVGDRTGDGMIRQDTTRRRRRTTP